MEVTCHCPVAHRHFTTDFQRIEQFGAVAFVWFSCPFCDRAGCTSADPDYDPRLPQLHCQQIDITHKRVRLSRHPKQMKHSVLRRKNSSLQSKQPTMRFHTLLVGTLHHRLNNDATH